LSIAHPSRSRNNREDMGLRIAGKTRPAKTRANLRSSQKKKRMSEPTLSWVCPPERTEIIENLVSGVGTSISTQLARKCVVYLRWLDRYNPSNIGILEDYLYHQTRSEENDCLANLAVLKLSVVSPDVLIAINLASGFRIQISVQSHPVQLRRRDPHPHKSSHILPVPRLPPMRFATRRAAIVR